MALTYDPFAAARTIGESWHREPGGVFFEEHQITHTLRCLKRTAYDDNESARLRRHLLIEAGTGVGKSTIQKEFLVHIAGAKDVMDADKNRNYPVFLDVGGSGISWERMRGSATDKGDLVYPLFRGVDYLVASEFLAFMGSKAQEVRERANELCRILEEGHVTVALIKMASANDKKKAKFEEDLAGTGITYNAFHNGMSYDVDLFLLAASRPMREVEDQAKYLREAGLLARLARRSWNTSEKNKRAFRRNQFGRPNEEAILRLRTHNLYAYRVPVHKVNQPPTADIQAVMDFYHDHYEKICEDARISIDEVASGRDFNDAAQLLCARAASRTFVSAQEQNLQAIEEIAYDERFVEWVKDFREPYLANLYEEKMAQANDDPKTDAIREMLVHYLKDRLDDDENPMSRTDDPTIDGTSLNALVMKKFNVKQSAAYDKMKAMRTAGIIEVARFNLYRIVDRQILTKVGMADEDEEGGFTPEETRLSLAVQRSNRLS